MPSRVKNVETPEPTNDELIALMQRRAGIAPEPGSLRTQQVVHRGDEALPAPQVVSSLQSAGYCYIYDTRTGERSVTNRNMLLAQLEKKREDGSQVFTVDDPKITPTRGSHKCLLHPDDPRRAEYDAMGLVVCAKANLTSPYQVTMHMRHRHPAEWATIEEERLRREKAEERVFQQKMLETVVSK